jgi:hypothetical protein
VRALGGGVGARRWEGDSNLPDEAEEAAQAQAQAAAQAKGRAEAAAAVAKAQAEAMAQANAAQVTLSLCVSGLGRVAIARHTRTRVTVAGTDCVMGPVHPCRPPSRQHQWGALLYHTCVARAGSSEAGRGGTWAAYRMGAQDNRGESAVLHVRTLHSSSLSDRMRLTRIARRRKPHGLLRLK